MPRAIREYTLSIVVTSDAQHATLNYTVHDDADTDLADEGSLVIQDMFTTTQVNRLRGLALAALRAANKIPD